MAFHLQTYVPRADGVADTYISTMWDGVKRPESGSYETCLFRWPGRPHGYLPEFHWRTQEMATSAHRKFVHLAYIHAMQGGA